MQNVSWGVRFLDSRFVEIRQALEWDKWQPVGSVWLHIESS